VVVFCFKAVLQDIWLEGTDTDSRFRVLVSTAQACYQLKLSVYKPTQQACALRCMTHVSSGHTHELKATKTTKTLRKNLLRDIRGSVFFYAFERKAPPDLRCMSQDSVVCTVRRIWAE